VDAGLKTQILPANQVAVAHWGHSDSRLLPMEAVYDLDTDANNLASDRMALTGALRLWAGNEQA
jgi:hypothetical protein